MTHKSNNLFFPTWIEISKKALKSNIKTILSVLDATVTPSFCVKGNAYGHDIRTIAQLVEEYAPHAWLNVHSLEEAALLRSSEIKSPIYCMGPLLTRYIEYAIRFDTRFVAYNEATLRTANTEARKQKKIALIHLKVETGTHRQGVHGSEILRLLKIARTLPHIHIEGIATHFANIEDIPLRTFFSGKKSDTPKLSGYPADQLAYFLSVINECSNAGYTFEKIHCANSAATLLFKETHCTMVRPGIALYGMWPSQATHDIFAQTQKAHTLTPIMEWKTRVGQIKTVPKGSYIGYGCTYKTTQKTKLAVLPVGYSDGYDRGLSNKAHVIIHNKKAPLRGRVFMNMLVVDCTKIPTVKEEDEVTLLGAGVTAQDHAAWAQTIDYEITTRIRESIPRLAK